MYTTLFLSRTFFPPLSFLSTNRIYLLTVRDAQILGAISL